MRILRIISTMNPKKGGPSQGIRNSIPALKDLGVDTEVICLDDPHADFLNYDDFTIKAIGPAKGGWSYCSALSGWLKENVHYYDVIVIHGLWLYHSYATIRETQRSGYNRRVPKIFVMPHGMLDPWFQRDKSRKLKALRNEIYWRLIERNVVNSADGLLFTCEQELVLARQTFKGYNPKREIDVGYGIQAPPFFKESIKDVFLDKHPSVGRKPFLLFLSRIHQKKGVDLLIEAYCMLEKERVVLPDLVIAGPLDGHYAIEMQEKARKSKKIHFTGMLQGDEKWGAFYCCEAFILPSHQENFGISVVEALACGKPVLISDQINIYKEVLNGGGGIVRQDTLEGTMEGISSWLNLTNVEKEIMRRNAFDTYNKYFTIESAARKFLDGLLQ